MSFLALDSKHLEVEPIIILEKNLEEVLLLSILSKYMPQIFIIQLELSIVILKKIFGNYQLHIVAILVIRIKLLEVMQFTKFL
jgi:hypothetical protein